MPKSAEVLEPKTNKTMIKAREINGVGYSEIILSMDTSQPAGKMTFTLVVLFVADPSSFSYQRIRMKASEPTKIGTVLSEI